MVYPTKQCSFEKVFDPAGERKDRFDVLSVLLDDDCSNGRVRQLVSKYSGKGIEGSRPPPFSSKLLRK